MRADGRPADAHTAREVVRPLRVLHVYELFDTFGGVERVLRLLVAAQAPQMKRVDVLCCLPRGVIPIEVGLSNVRCTRVSSWGRLARNPIAPGFARQFAMLATEVDLIHLHSPFPLGEFCLLASRVDKPVITSWHHDVVRQRLLRQVYQPLVQRSLSRAAVICPATGSYASASPFLASHQAKVCPVPYGIDIDQFTTAAPERVEAVRARFGDRFVLFVGRLVYYKGLTHLVEAMPRIPAPLVIAGVGPLQAVLHRQACRLGIGDRVHFTGAISAAELSALYHAATVFVLPSCHRTEAFGIVQVEAMAAGLPVVSTDIPGVREVNRHGETGLLVPPGDPDALAEAVKTLLTDDDLRQQLGRTASARARREYHYERMAHRYLQLYAEVLTGSRCRAAQAGSPREAL